MSSTGIYNVEANLRTKTSNAKVNLHNLGFTRQVSSSSEINNLRSIWHNTRKFDSKIKNALANITCNYQNLVAKVESFQTWEDSNWNKDGKTLSYNLGNIVIEINKVESSDQMFYASRVINPEGLNLKIRQNNSQVYIYYDFKNNELSLFTDDVSDPEQVKSILKSSEHLEFLLALPYFVEGEEL